MALQACTLFASLWMFCCRQLNLSQITHRWTEPQSSGADVEFDPLVYSPLRTGCTTVLGFEICWPVRSFVHVGQAWDVQTCAKSGTPSTESLEVPEAQAASNVVIQAVQTSQAESKTASSTDIEESVAALLCLDCNSLSNWYGPHLETCVKQHAGLIVFMKLPEWDIILLPESNNPPVPSAPDLPPPAPPPNPLPVPPPPPPPPQPLKGFELWDSSINSAGSNREDSLSTYRNAYLASVAANAAYKVERKSATYFQDQFKKWGVLEVRIRDDDLTDTEIVVLANKKVIMVAAAGTEAELSWDGFSIQDIIVDLLGIVTARALSSVDGRESVAIHSGFAVAAGNNVQWVSDTINSMKSKFPYANVVLTGHSLGGCLSFVLAAMLARNYGMNTFLVHSACSSIYLISAACLIRTNIC